MRKYVTIPDVRDYPSYRNPNTMRVYIHACMCMDLKTRNYTHSIRRLAADLCMTVRQVRTALKQLEGDGIISTQMATQMATRGLTQMTTHMTTQIHIMSVSELDRGGDRGGDIDGDTDGDTIRDTDGGTDNKNNNIPKSSTSTHMDARVKDEDLVRLAAKEFSISGSEAAALLEKFYRRQALKDKKWDGDGDKTAHFIAWCEKNMPRKSAPRKTDTQAREAEYSRAAEQEAEKTDQEKAYEEITRLHRWIADDRKKLKQCQDEEGKAKLQDLIRQLTEEYNRKVDEYNNKYNRKEAS